MFTAASTVCELEKDSGPCSDYRAVWYFEPVNRQCRRFHYGGCHGNANRFSSEEECQTLCLQQQQQPGYDDVTQTTWQPVTWPVTDDNDRRQADDSVQDVYGQRSSLLIICCNVMYCIALTLRGLVGLSPVNVKVGIEVGVQFNAPLTQSSHFEGGWTLEHNAIMPVHGQHC